MTDYGLVVLPGQGELIIGGVSMSTPAWWTLDLSPLWEFPELRGQSTLYPGVSGRTANIRRVDETTYRVPMHITGAVDRTGTPHANPVMGLKINLDYLWENVVSVGSVTRAATLELPDESILEADVQIQIVLGELAGSYDKSAVLFVTVPAGRFEESGS